jgi:THO complex subunit 3
LKTFYVTQTGAFDGVCVYTFPKNHDSRTFTCLLRSSAGYDRIETTKLMASADAAMCAKAAREVEKQLKK